MVEKTEEWEADYTVAHNADEQNLDLGVVAYAAVRTAADKDQPAVLDVVQHIAAEDTSDYAFADGSKDSDLHASHSSNRDAIRIGKVGKRETAWIWKAGKESANDRPLSTCRV